jgi:hypothetical protein
MKPAVSGGRFDPRLAAPSDENEQPARADSRVLRVAEGVAQTGLSAAVKTIQ